MNAFIDDGYQLTHHIAEVPRLHPAVTLCHRAVLPSEVTHWGVAVSGKTPDERARITADWMAKRIVAWTLDRPPTAENLLRLQPILYQKVQAVTFGESSGDLLPDGREPEQFDPEGEGKNWSRGCG